MGNTAKMVKSSVLNDALKSMNNAEKAGKRQVLIRPSSKVIVKFLQVMQKHGYIGEFEEVDDHRNGKIVVQLNGRLNKTGVISPRYNVQLRDLEQWVVKLLPSRQFGYIVLTTSWYHGPRGGQEKARRRQDHRFLLLDDTLHGECSQWEEKWAIVRDWSDDELMARNFTYFC